MSEADSSQVVTLHDVSKVYRSYPTPRHRLLELLSGGRRSYSRETRALDGVSLTLEKGARLGIIGVNGSGKSTLLKLLAGVLQPTSGSVTVRGRVSALLELGAGFNPELPGRENIRQFCMLHGMRQHEIAELEPTIVAFSELRDAVDHPVKTYSSGMAVRLGFSCAVHVQPDILVVDEALSVGDAYFQNKCLHKIRDMLDQGISFIYVAHAVDAVRSLCEDGLWLDNGRVRKIGSSTAVGAAYQAEVFRRLTNADFGSHSRSSVAAQAVSASQTSEPVRQPLLDTLRFRTFAERVEPLRTGSGEIRIQNIELLDDRDEPTDVLPFDNTARLRIYFHALKEVTGLISLGVGIYDRHGVQLMHFNSLTGGVNLAEIPVGEDRIIDFEFKCPLVPGEYGLGAGVAEARQAPGATALMLAEHVIDYCIGGARFSISRPEATDQRDLWGICHAEYSVTLQEAQ